MTYIAYISELYTHNTLYLFMNLHAIIDEKSFLTFKVQDREFQIYVYIFYFCVKNVKKKISYYKG